MVTKRKACIFRKMLKMKKLCLHEKLALSAFDTKEGKGYESFHSDSSNILLFSHARKW